MKPMVAALGCAMLWTGAAQAQQPGAPATDPVWIQQQLDAHAKLKVEDGWGYLPGNVRWRRVSGPGTGAHPKASDTVRIHYAGTFTDGKEFDSSWTRGEPASFPLARLIKAWQYAVPMAGVGDTIEIAVPAAMGYGSEGRGPIPGGATLLFKIELLGIE